MTPADALPPLIRAMLEPGFYPHRPARVELEQTHISFVLLAGEHVYKVKKPVRFAFLDFSTLERRRYFCHEEVRLNRRLAPRAYEGVVALRGSGTGFALAEESASDAIEYAVHMRRLPADRMLPALLERGTATTAVIDAVAATLAAFHAAADAGPDVARGGDPDVIERLMEDDFGEVDVFHGDTIAAADDAAIRGFCRTFLRRHEALLRRRQAGGRIRDGHGDLHAEHICCTEPLTIFDCIEFNPSFRHRDVAAEIAFLAMDLLYRARADLAEHLVARYAALTDDPELPALIPFYACHRAYIRGKVDSLKSREPEVGDAERAAARASAIRYFALSYRYTWTDAPRLVVVVGLSGTGKSTLAAALGERTGLARFSSDVIRKQLAGLPLTQRGGPELYTPTQNARTYAAMYGAAAQELAGGRGAIMDATFQRRVDRDAARALARRAGAPILFVECVCSEAVIRRRLAARTRRGTDPSDADWAIYKQKRSRYEPFAGDEDGDRVAVDTAAPQGAQLAPIEAALRSR